MWCTRAVARLLITVFRSSAIKETADDQKDTVRVIVLVSIVIFLLFGGHTYAAIIRHRPLFSTIISSKHHINFLDTNSRAYKQGERRLNSNAFNSQVFANMGPR